MEHSLLQRALSFVEEGVLLFTTEGVITFVNPHAIQLLGYDDNELIGKYVDSVLGLVRDDSPLSSSESVQYLLFVESKDFSMYSNKMIYITTSAGKKVPVFIKGKIIRGEHGKQGIVIFRDVVNEQQIKQYKEHTAKRLSKLTPVFQRAATGDFSIVPEVPSVDDEFTELFVGLRLMVEDLQEITIDREHEQKKRIAAIQKVAEDRRKFTQEYTAHLEEQVTKKTREISLSKMHVETIIENLINGLLEYDNSFRLLRINRPAEELLGVTRKEVLGKEILPKDMHKEHWQTLVDVSYPALSPDAKKIRYTEPLRNDANITEIKVSYPLERELQVITVPVIDSVGARQGFIKVIRDITREKTIARSKSEFISIAAHQLRTPLSAIKWILHMILDGDTGPLSKSQKELLSGGYDTNERMIHLVNDLLNVARIEEGRFGYKFVRNDIMKIVDSVVVAVKGFALSRKVSVDVKITSKPQLFVFDANKIMLAIQNIVDNAVKYTQANGAVTIEVDTDKESVVLCVQDTGIGIPSSQINRLFTKFFRADNAVRVQTDGSGLGLYLAKNIVLRHGGTLTVSSKEGAGTAFTLTLPMDERKIPKDDLTMDEL